MKNQYPLKLKDNPYLQSALLHLILLLIMALVHFSIQPKQSWYQFDWLSEKSEIEDVLATISEAPYDSYEEENISISDDNFEESLPEAMDISPGESEIAEKLSEEPKQEEKTQLSGTMAKLLNPKSSAGSAVRGTQGFQTSFLQGDSEAYFTHSKTPDVKPLMDDSVVVEFKLNANGKVNMSTVNVISYRKAEHWQALRKAMEAWKFGFKGAYNPNQIYRIKCNFSLN